MTTTPTMVVETETLTRMEVGDVMGAAGGVDVFRVKLTTPPTVPDGVTESWAPDTPAVDIEVVKVPDPDVATEAVWPHPTLSVVGLTISEGAGVVGAASPAGPGAPITDDDSSTRLSASVTMIDAVPHPLCVTR